MWPTAIALGLAVAGIAGPGGGGNPACFRVKAEVFIAVRFHVAALGGAPVIWLMRAVNGELLTQVTRIWSGVHRPGASRGVSEIGCRGTGYR